MGMSIAASYTWAAAIIVGLSMLKEQGIIPFVLWFLANTTAVILFGWVVIKWPGIYLATRYIPFRVINSIILLFILWFNMTGIVWVNSITGWLPDTGAKILAIGTAVVLWVIISKGGIKWSIITDQFQWFLLAGGCAIALLITLFSGGFILEPGLQLGILSTGRDWLMAFWSVPLLLTALFLDGMFWQRARYIKTIKPYAIGYGLFTIYLFLVAGLGFFVIPPAAMAVVFVVVYFSSQSTMDSVLSGMHHQMTKKWGMVTGAIAIGVWLLVSGIGILDLWMVFFGWFPLLFIGLIVTYILLRRGKIPPPSLKAILAEDALPDLEGRPANKLEDLPEVRR